MRISTKGRYALRMMIDMATHDDGNPIRIKDIAKRQQISDKYLEQIVSILQKAQFVKSIRGPMGGYLLTKKPEEYTAGMILRLIEGSLSPVACLVDDVNECIRQNECATLPLWKKLDEAISNVVDNVTIADLIDWQSQGSYVI